MESLEVVVVSGLPRSGTSLMMQVLAAGGVPVRADAERPPDVDNPRGYLEYAPVKATSRDASWVVGARGRAVKVIHRLLPELPADERYAVVWMRRALAEVWASQEAMLARRGGAPPLERERFERVFGDELRTTRAWLARQPAFRVLDVDYAKLVAAPEPVLESLETFLARPLDRAAMRSAVAPELHRQRL